MYLRYSLLRSARAVQRAHPQPRLAHTSSTRTKHTLPTTPCKQYLEPTHTATLTPLSQESKAVINASAKYMLPVYARPGFVLSHGKGSYVWDMEGRKYLDFSAGIAVNALGHSDEGVAKVLGEQAAKLLHTSNVYHHPGSTKLAELIVELTRKEGGLGLDATSGAKIFFSNSGTEANEGALKIARKVGKDRGGPNKSRILCFENAFHGRSMGALSVTSNPKYQQPFMPLLPGVDVGRVNEMAALELITNETCAVIVEPIQGEGGINAAKEEWLKAIRKRCDEVGAVLIFDEIQCGLFRTGKLWAHSALDSECHPDIVTMAKPLANGYPIGAVLMRDAIAETMTAGTHGTTFGGSPLACAVGYHVLSRLSAPEFAQQLQESSDYLQARLARLTEWFPSLLEEQIRGRGMILGLGFKDTSIPAKVVDIARERGLFVLTAGSDAVRIVPSLNIGKEEIDQAVDVLESVLQIVTAESVA